MPFTPLHMGPGLAIKVVGGRYFSLMVFGFSQVAMDIEPLVRILRGDPLLHGMTHTYLGATFIALLSIGIGRPVCQHLLRYWKPDPRSGFLNWLRGNGNIPWPAAISGAVLGAYSHVLLDSIMHADMRPFAPWSATNAMLRFLSIETLHDFCVVSGALGAILIVLVFLTRTRRDE